MSSKDFSKKVRKAAKEASDNGRLWWIESYIINSYLWRGPTKELSRQKTDREQQNDEIEEKESNLQPVDELC